LKSAVGITLLLWDRRAKRGGATRLLLLRTHVRPDDGVAWRKYEVFLTARARFIGGFMCTVAHPWQPVSAGAKPDPSDDYMDHSFSMSRTVIHPLAVKTLAGPLVFGGISFTALVGYGPWITGGAILPARLLGLAPPILLAVLALTGLLHALARAQVLGDVERLWAAIVRAVFALVLFGLGARLFIVSKSHFAGFL